MRFEVTLTTGVLLSQTFCIPALVGYFERPLFDSGPTLISDALMIKYGSIRFVKTVRTEGVWHFHVRGADQSFFFL